MDQNSPLATMSRLLYPSVLALKEHKIVGFDGHHLLPSSTVKSCRLVKPNLAWITCPPSSGEY